MNITLKNHTKYNSYRHVALLMKLAEQENNLPYSIASIALAESVIADRMQSFISFADREWFQSNKDKHIKTAVLIDMCNKYFKNYHVKIKRKDSSIFETNDLFQELKNWLKERNFILHSFAKSTPGNKTMEVDKFIEYSISVSKNGYRLVSLLKKWSDKQKHKSKN